MSYTDADLNIDSDMFNRVNMILEVEETDLDYATTFDKETINTSPPKKGSSPRITDNLYKSYIQNVKHTKISRTKKHLSQAKNNNDIQDLISSTGSACRGGTRLDKPPSKKNKMLDSKSLNLRETHRSGLARKVSSTINNLSSKFAIYTDDNTTIDLAVENAKKIKKLKNKQPKGTKVKESENNLIGNSKIDLLIQSSSRTKKRSKNGPDRKSVV